MIEAHIQTGEARGWVMRKREDESEGFIFFEDDDEDELLASEEEIIRDESSESKDSQVESSELVSFQKDQIIPLQDILPKRDDEYFSAELVTDGIHNFEWPIKGMDCPDCAMKASSATNKNPAVASCKISPADGMVRLGIDLGKGDLAKANRILSSLGHEPDVDWFRLSGVTVESVMKRQHCDRTSLKRLLLSAPGILDVRLEEKDILIRRPPTMLPLTRQEHELALERMTGKSVELVKGDVIGLSTEHWRLIGASIALVLLPIIVLLQAFSMPTIVIAGIGILGTTVGGFRMFMEAIASIRNRVLGFQILTTMAVLGAAILQHWPEALMVVLLESVSGHLESSALVRARDAMQGGLDRLPRVARVVSGDKPRLGTVSSTTFSTGISPLSSLEPSRPEPEEIPIELIFPGTMVEVRSGELIPVDGIITEGVGQIDRAPLTGESVPIRVEEGEFVEAGLVLLRGPILIEVSAVGEDTALSNLIDRVHTYRDKPPRLQSSVELFTKFWVPTVLLGGLGVALIYGEWMMMLLLWVVACPCALLLAAPIPHATALSTAAHRGVIARGGDVLERAARVDLALLDKTGTLTSGQPRLNSLVLADGVSMLEALSLAAGLEVRSNHPYASTIMLAAESEDAEPIEVKSLADGVAGVSGKSGRSKVRLGSQEWLTSEGISIAQPLHDAANDARTDGLGVSILSKSNDAIAVFTFINDDLRVGAKSLINDLSELGISVELLSGDSQPAVEALGNQLGIDSRFCRGDIDPDGKAIWVERRSQALCTMMAGDGFNDAAALAAADVGVAVGSGESVNLDAADVLIPSNDPRILSRLIRLSKKTRLIVNINLAISLIVTLILVISVVDRWHDSLALGVFVHEGTALITLLNGIWLADENMSRLGTLGNLFKQLGRDCMEAWGSLKGLVTSSD
uniref:Heavy metal translocating P-type ATPase (ZntA) n=1 Tax=uncultured marine group II/III euryarchaeote KM3_12_C02 TaxID=1457858 RepID=A0A075GEK0_9EURY|nr:heavy metal translocating P-type ATPase (zntA) [uncultured marine group II/III euryarchaeote KM3_12_C02]